MLGRSKAYALGCVNLGTVVPSSILSQMQRDFHSLESSLLHCERFSIGLARGFLSFLQYGSRGSQSKLTVPFLSEIVQAECRHFWKRYSGPDTTSSFVCLIQSDASDGYVSPGLGSQTIQVIVAVAAVLS